MENRKSENRKLVENYLAIAAAVLFWSMSYIWTKNALVTFSPLALMALRYGIAGLVVLIVFVVKGFPKFAPVDFLRISIMALFFPFLYYLLETFALQYTTATEAGIIAAALPMFATLFSALFLRERTGIPGILGILGSFIGIIILMSGGSESIGRMSENLLGNGMMVMAMFAAASYMVVMKTLGDRYSTTDVTGTQILVGTFYILVFSIIRRDLMTIRGFSIVGFSSILGLALLSTLLAFFCYNLAISRMPVSNVSIFINTVPIITATLAWILLGERLNAIQMLGGLIVISSVSVASVLSSSRSSKIRTEMS